MDFIAHYTWICFVLYVTILSNKCATKCQFWGVEKGDFFIFKIAYSSYDHILFYCTLCYKIAYFCTLCDCNILLFSWFFFSNIFIFKLYKWLNDVNSISWKICYVQFPTVLCKGNRIKCFKVWFFLYKKRKFINFIT